MKLLGDIAEVLIPVLLGMLIMMECINFFGCTVLAGHEVSECPSLLFTSVAETVREMTR